MKTLDQIIGYQGGDNCNAIDPRDKSRLLDFIPVEHWKALGFLVKEGTDPLTIVPTEFTKVNVLERLKTDLAFAFDKALGQRGISASLMNDVIKMWMWVLDDPLADDQEYAQYGLPLLKKVAVKYGLPNEIGDDHGNEARYASH